MRKAFLISLALITIFFSHAQSETTEYPEVGKVCPDFTLQNIKYFSKSGVVIQKATLQNFNNQWLILDFWNKDCGACIASFPKISNLQKQFDSTAQGKVQFMLVGIQDRERQIEPMFARFRERNKLVMPCAFDSTLANRFDIYTAPYIIVIDPTGVVRAITYSLSATDVQAFLDGKSPRLEKAYRVHEDVKDDRTPFNKTKPFLIGGNGGNDTTFLFRSVLAAWDGFAQHNSIPNKIAEDSANGMFQVLGVPLYHLYNYAYYGTRFPGKGYRAFPILETKDSAHFQSSSVHNTGFFSYSLQMPATRANTASMQSTLRHDLENYFGLAVSLETRKFPCWRLVMTSQEATARLQTKGGKSSFKSIIPRDDFTLRNFAFIRFVDDLRYFTASEIIDETGLSASIDIHVDHLTDGPTGVRPSLQRYGLDLVPGEQELKVLVIRDINSSASQK